MAYPVLILLAVILALDCAPGFAREAEKREAPLTEEPLAMVPLQAEKTQERDFGSVVAGATGEVSWTLRHAGTKAVVVESSDVDPPFVMVGQNCAGRWEPGRTCEVKLRFEPKEAGAFQGTLRLVVSGDYEEKELLFRLSGLAQRPARIEIEGETAFPPLVLSQLSDRQVTLRNTGDVEAKSVSPRAEGKGFQVTGCGGLLGPGQSCVASLRFKPQGAGGQTGKLVVAYQNGLSGTTAERSLAGSGLRPARLVANVPTGGDLGRRILGTTSSFLLSVANLGDLPAKSVEVAAGFNAPFSFRGGKFPGEGGDCGKEIPARSTCRLGVQIAPLFAGISEQAFSLRYLDGLGAQTVGHKVRAEAITPARLLLREKSPAEFPQRILTSVVEERFHIFNEGQGEASLLRILPQDFKGIFQLTQAEGSKASPCGATLAPNSECEFAVRFSSRNQGVFESSVLVQYHNGVAEQSYKFPLRAKALSPAKMVIEHKGPLEFGELVTDLSKFQFVTLYNEGEVPTDKLDAVALKLPFFFKWEKQKGTDQEICGQAVHGGRRCLIKVVYAPTEAGLSNVELKVNYNDGLTERSVGLPMKGKALKPARLELVGQSPVDFGVGLVTGTVEKTLTFKNTGDVPTTALGVKIPADKKAAFLRQDMTCPEKVEPGKQCDVKVTFAAPAKGDHEGQLLLSYGDGRENPTATEVKMKGTGKPTARLVLSEKDKIEFGRLLLGQQGDRILTITNEGEHAAQKLKATVADGTKGFGWKGNKFPGEGGDCGEGLEPGKSCRLALAFLPGGAGTATDGLAVEYDNGAKPGKIERPLLGLGIAPGTLELASTELEFGVRVTGSKATKTVEAKNIGGEELDFIVDKTVLTGAFGFSGGKFPGEGGNCGTKLGAGKNCRLELVFAPDKERVHGEKLKLAYTDRVAPEKWIEVGMKGESRSRAELVTTPATLPDFGKRFVGESPELVVKIQNRGGTEADLNVKSTKDGAFSLSHTCPTKLAPNGVCDLTVKFVPEKAKPYDGKIRLSFFDGLEKSERELATSGEGQLPADLRLSNGRLDFGRRRIGESISRQVKLENRGTVEGTDLEGTSPSGPFRWEGGSFPGKEGDCRKRLAPGSSCSLSLQFDPRTGGESESQVEIRFFDGKAAQSLPLELKGLGEEPPPPPRDISSDEEREKRPESSPKGTGSAP